MDKRIKLLMGSTLFALTLSACGTVSSSNDSSEQPLTSDSSSEPIVTSEETTSEPTSISEGGDVELDLFALNDLHGSIEFNEDDQSEWGMYKIGSYLREKEALNPGGTINMDTGDMWQGSADSNITRGKVLIEMLNSLNWAATSLGNHEFDWYDEVIEENREHANYPFLGANIIDKSTNQLATNLVDGGSTLIERNGVKVGIIGTIGSRLESSILASAIAPYSLEPTTDYIIGESLKLEQQGAELIILLTHDSLTSYSSGGEYGPVIEPSGREPYVDVVFTGHEHAFDRQMVNGVPILQTNGNGKQLMHVNLTVSSEGVTINEYTHISDELANYPNDPQIEAAYDIYANEISIVKDEVVGELTAYAGKSQLVKLANRSMLEEAQKTFDADVAIHNFGGVRVNEIASGTVTYGDIYKAFPFDNTVVVVEDVPGSVVSAAMSGNGYYYREGLTGIDYNETYTVVSINFITESSYNSLKNYSQTVLENVFVRDLVADFFRTNQQVDPYNI